jgi:hypothetical protein
LYLWTYHNFCHLQAWQTPHLVHQTFAGPPQPFLLVNEVVQISTPHIRHFQTKAAQICRNLGMFSQVPK